MSFQPTAIRTLKKGEKVSPPPLLILMCPIHVCVAVQVCIVSNDLLQMKFPD